MFNELLSKIDESDLQKIFSSDSSPIIKALTKRRLQNFIVKIQQTLLKITQEYYKGYPGNAFNLLYKLLKENKFAPKRDRLKATSAKRYIDDEYEYGNYFTIKMQCEFMSFYRMRMSDDNLTKEELFHIPFEKREIVSTARFSIPGFPCLYLGTSLEVCWNEIGRSLNGKERVFACKYKNYKPLAFLNLTIPQGFRNGGFDNNTFDILRFLITYPFYSACLIKVEFPNSPFKPEYVIPQLLLQYVKQEDFLDGIIYSSTKDKSKNNENFHNVVIPTIDITDSGHCNQLKKWYYSSDVKVINPNNLNSDIFALCSVSKIR